MATDVRAKLSYCGVSAQKARLVINEIRGKNAVESLTKLSFMTQGAACQEALGFCCGEC